MSTTTGSAKIDRIIAQAERGGLDVNVEIRDEAKYGRQTRYVNVELRVTNVGEGTLLDSVTRSKVVCLSWMWQTDQMGATPKLYWASERSYGGSRDLFTSKYPMRIWLPVAIDGMIRENKSYHEISGK